MIISIIQPCFIPWLGYFEQIALADIFVYLDDVQYTRKDWRNNNKLKSPAGPKGVYFSTKKEPLGTKIKDIHILHHIPWEKALRNQLLNWYGKSPYYEEIMALIEPHFQAKYQDLVSFNSHLNQSILDYLHIDTLIYKSSDIPCNTTNKISRIGEICGFFDDVDILFDGKSAQNFLSPNSFAAQGIKIVFQDYQHKNYPQCWGAFVPSMSILDCLFNCGPMSKEYIITEHSQQSLALK